MTTQRDIYNYIEFAREDGEKRTQERIAKQMLADSVPVDTIVKYTGLSAEAIEALKQ